MVVLQKLKFLNGGVMSSPSQFMPESPEIARDKVEYLQNLTKPYHFHEKL